MQTPAYWDGTHWIVQSISPLSPGQLRRVGAFLLKVQKQRRVGLAPGAMRDECDLTIRALETGKLLCGVRPTYNGPDGCGFNAFAASAGTGKIFIGAGA